MTLRLRLNDPHSYNSDILAITSAVRANGINNRLELIDVSSGENSVRLLINLPYSANTRHQTVSASLYIIGFQNNNGVFIFNDNNYHKRFSEQFQNQNYNNLDGINGSYASLGFSNSFSGLDNNNNHHPLQLTLHNLNAAVRNIASFSNNDNWDERNSANITRLIITSSEAVRSRDVCRGVALSLNRPTENHVPTYNPNDHWDIMHNWRGSGLAK